MGFNIPQLIFSIMNRSAKGSQDRLGNLFTGVEKDFGVQPKVTPDDLMNYEDVHGRPWPKQDMPDDALARMQADTGGTDFAVNVPQEVVASPLSLSQRAEQTAEVASAGKAAGQRADAANFPDTMGSIFDALGQFSKDKGLGFTANDQLSNMNMGRAPAWDPAEAGPGDSLIQTDANTGQTQQIVPRDHYSENKKVPPEVKQAQSFILKFSGAGTDPTMAMLLTLRPELAANPAFSQMLGNGVPEQYKSVFNDAMRIVQNYYQEGTAGMQGGYTFQGNQLIPN